MGGDERLRCAFCGDVIGVYEPLVLVEGGDVRETSLAADPEAASADATYLHGACHTALAGDADVDFK